MAKLERYDKDCYRIMQDGAVIALILGIANGAWGLFDTDSNPLSASRYISPKSAFAAWETLKGGEHG